VKRGEVFWASQAGVAICHQVTTLDRAKLTERLGTLSDAARAAVESGLKAALDRN
jgi:mRNA-degrading endonuclease toxin of MazEF toxin-antitoxin module